MTAFHVSLTLHPYGPNSVPCSGTCNVQLLLYYCFHLQMLIISSNAIHNPRFSLFLAILGSLICECLTNMLLCLHLCALLWHLSPQMFLLTLFSTYPNALLFSRCGSLCLDEPGSLAYLTILKVQNCLTNGQSPVSGPKWICMSPCFSWPM